QPVPPFATFNIPARVSEPDEVTGPPVNERPVEPPEASTEVTVPVFAPTQVPLTAKQPVLTFTPEAKEEVALPDTVRKVVEALPFTLMLPAKVEVAVVDVAVIQATVGEVDDWSAAPAPDEKIQP